MRSKVTVILLLQAFCHYVRSNYDGRPNLALNKPTQQSSDVLPSARAVDGDENPRSTDGESCSQTEPDFPSWWQVDLMDVYVISSIQITNRLGREGRLRNFSVEVSLERPALLDGFPGRTGSPICVEEHGQLDKAETRQYHCPRPIVGRFLRLINLVPEHQSLSICEFKVFGGRGLYFRWSSSFALSPTPFEVIPGLRSRIECAHRCALKVMCYSFEMHVPSNTCQLMASPTAGNGEHDLTGVRFKVV